MYLSSDDNDMMFVISIILVINFVFKNLDLSLCVMDYLIEFLPMLLIVSGIILLLFYSNKCQDTQKFTITEDLNKNGKGYVLHFTYVTDDLEKIKQITNGSTLITKVPLSEKKIDNDIGNEKETQTEKEKEKEKVDK